MEAMIAEGARLGIVDASKTAAVGYCFGGAVHSFTDPTANTPGRSMYDAALARRSYALMREFLAETF